VTTIVTKYTEWACISMARSVYVGLASGFCISLYQNSLLLLPILYPGIRHCTALIEVNFSNENSLLNQIGIFNFYFNCFNTISGQEMFCIAAIADDVTHNSGSNWSIFRLTGEKNSFNIFIKSAVGISDCFFVFKITYVPYYPWE